jgi:hypothetical protein
MAAELGWGESGAAGCTAGHPSIQPTPITNAAATAPETGAMIQGEIGRGAGVEAGGGAGASGGGSGGTSPAAGCVSLETWLASRSMVGGARLGRSESGNDPVSSDLSSTITAVPLNSEVPELSRIGVY